jgi:uncharacterized repeat protein (TIGR03847 family)
MSIVVHNFEEPDRFVAGTVGEPGQRTFFLQAREGARVTSVALEKQQVSILAERVDLLLDEALRRSGGDPTIPAVAPVGVGDQEPLDLPIVEEFRVGTITLSWDTTEARVVIELFPVTDETVVMQAYDSDESDDSDDSDEPDISRTSPAEPGEDVELEVEVEASEVLIVKLDPGYARSFVRRAQTVVSAGRAPCQFCGNPIDPDGHLCPRANGFRRIAD